MRRTLAGIAGLTFVLAAGTAAAQQELKFGVFTPAKEVTFESVMQPFADRVNADAGGTIKIVTYPNGALSRDPAGQVKLVQDGVLDMAYVIPSYNPGRFNDIDVFDLPNMIDTAREGSIAAWNLYDKKVMRGFDDFVVIAMLVTPLSQIHTAKPLNKVDDLKGLKIRTGSANANLMVQALGATPVGMPITQAPENISRGVLDGISTNLAALFDFRVADVTPNHYMTNLGGVVLSVLMNKKKFDSLPDKAKAAIMKHRGLVLSQGYLADDVTNANLVKIQADPRRRVVFPDKADAAAAQARLDTVIDAWVKKDPYNAKLLAALRAEVAAQRGGKKS